MIAGVVILGVLGAVVVNAVSGLPSGPLPGVALGSEPLLVVERAVAFFAAWMIFVVVIDQALRGRLPVEVSGRGLRYADVEAAHATRIETEDAIHGIESELDRLGALLGELEVERKPLTTE